MAKPSFPPSRGRWTEADARRVLADWKRTGGTLEQFAKARGLVPQRISWWQKQLRSRSSAAPAALSLVPATVVGVNTGGPSTVIRLPHGVVIEVVGVSPSWVAALARELARSQS